MDEQQKQRVLIAVFVFNVVIILYQVIFNLQFSWLRFLLGALIAAVAAAAAYFVMKFLS